MLPLSSVGKQAWRTQPSSFARPDSRGRLSLHEHFEVRHFMVRPDDIELIALHFGSTFEDEKAPSAASLVTLRWHFQ